ncbi:N-formylglutamate amidohydrolase [Alphaproteobacteria bacterium]|nr:N-formylglutamate amidohydrolase [Alphaproteobacteria bacterium]
MLTSSILNFKKTRQSFLFLNSSHSGRDYSDFNKNLSNLSIYDMRKSEDTYIDLLFDNKKLNINLLTANFPRIFVDLNRSPLELDPSMWHGKFNASIFNRSQKVSSGIGVIPKVCFSGKKVYNNLLLFKEARRRLLNYYFPYHRKFKMLIDYIKKHHNKVIILDCHSMSSEIVSDRTDIVLSNNMNKSANPIITNILQKLFESYGYKVSINHPFEGGFITKFYGRPVNRVNVIQIEVNKKLYLFEENFKVDKNNFNKLKNCFSDIINYINLSETEI